MRSSLILGAILLLTIAGASIVQAHEHDCGCNRLGSGVDACQSRELVVKAARVEKPLYRASPEVINEAVAAREMAERMSMGTVPGGVPSFPSSYGGASSSSCSSSNALSSSVGLLGRFIGGNHHLQSHGHSSGTGCDCGRKGAPLKLQDILSRNVQGRIVPSFPPIGDLCYPNRKQTELDVTTRVTPAYPAKLRCCPTHQKVCVNVMNGQIDQAEIEQLGMKSSYGHTGGLLDGRETIDGWMSGSASGALSGNLGGYAVSSALGSVYGSAGHRDSLARLSAGGWSGLSSGMGGHRSSASSYGELRSSGGGLTGSYAGSNGIFGSSAGSYAGNALQSLGQMSSGASGFGGASYSNAEAIQGMIGNSGSSCNEFGDDLELPEDYSYPRLPADPVSLTLAYKNLFPHVVLYNRKGIVPEDKLAFGHRTVPVESVPRKSKQDVPEEKLQILEKPVVELKPIAPVSVNLGVYDEQEEDKLAELEAIERERMNQETIAEQRQTHFITYGDLGYAPINGLLPGKLTSTEMLQRNLLETEDAVGGGCGPVGPPAPGYVPGNVMVNREITETEGGSEDDGRRDREKTYVHYGLGYETSEEEDDTDSVTSGIFGRLRNDARKYGPCFQNPL